MAREESDREDLLREATALVERAELDVRGQAVVMGFRHGGEFSVFFAAQPVYQFNRHGELRRAYAQGLLYKAQHGRLASLDRVRTPAAVELRRHDLDDAETTRFLRQMRDDLQPLAECLEAGSYSLVGQIPVDADVAARALPVLREIIREPRVARTPGAGR